MQITPLQKRAARKARNKTGLDMNLVALIDIFTIMIFFLLSSASGIEILTSPKSVKLPQSTADRLPRDTLVLVVNAEEILVDGRRVATVREAMGTDGDLIAALKTELDALSSRRLIRQDTQAQVASKGQAVTIMGDKDIPYQLLRKVMFTAARANYSDVSFAVTEKVKS